jgi:hypothetical protein
VVFKTGKGRTGANQFTVATREQLRSSGPWDERQSRIVRHGDEAERAPMIDILH